LPAATENAAALNTPTVATAEPEPTFDPSAVPPVTEKDYVKGSASTTVSIILYSDTQCPYCRMFYPILKDFLSQNSDIRFVYRPTPFHEEGKIEEQAMDCANDQGKYWEYLDAIYTSTDTENVTDATRLTKIATDVGLNGTTFEQCFTSQKYAGNIDTYLNAARSAGISGTPTSILVGPKGTKELRGASSIDTLKAAVDSVK
jgi:protein-disulfide isomerase